MEREKVNETWCALDFTWFVCEWRRETEREEGSLRVARKRSLQNTREEIEREGRGSDRQVEKLNTHKVHVICDSTDNNVHWCMEMITLFLSDWSSQLMMTMKTLTLLATLAKCLFSLLLFSCLFFFLFPVSTCVTYFCPHASRDCWIQNVWYRELTVSWFEYSQQSECTLLRKKKEQEEQDDRYEHDCRWLTASVLTERSWERNCRCVAGLSHNEIT